jgi:uncharacterized protein
MTERLRQLLAHEYRRERWRNGLGWTREIHREPARGAHDGDDDWLWRLSIAEVERDAAFSAFPGVDRELVLLQGNGLRLRFDDGETVELEPPHGRFRFPGERALRGEPVDGITHDFNLMWRRDRIEADLWHRPLVGSMVLFVEPGECWAVHLLAGRVQAGDSDLSVEAHIGDTLLLRADNTRARIAIDGGGEILVMRLRERRSG